MAKSGMRVGEYILSKPLGQGEFGEVWLAKHHAWKNQQAAVKIPTDPEYVRQLQREGYAIHGLQHPGIVRAMGFDPFGDPPYLVNEYVPGTTLRPLMGKLSIDDALVVMGHILDALEHAHARGVVHRDIKPENILVHADVKKSGFKPQGLVRVTDFGLAKNTAAATTSLVMSQSMEDGQVVGALQYMSPEQKRGGDVDGRSDLYACAVVLYELLTGRPPQGFELASELRKGVPPHIDTAIKLGMMTSLEARFKTAKAFAAALVPPPSVAKPAAKPAPKPKAQPKAQPAKTQPARAQPTNTQAKPQPKPQPKPKPAPKPKAPKPAMVWPKAGLISHTIFVLGLTGVLSFLVPLLAFEFGNEIARRLAMMLGVALSAAAMGIAIKVWDGADFSESIKFVPAVGGIMLFGLVADWFGGSILRMILQTGFTDDTSRVVAAIVMGIVVGGGVGWLLRVEDNADDWEAVPSALAGALIFSATFILAGGYAYGYNEAQLLYLLAMPFIVLIAFYAYRFQEGARRSNITRVTTVLWGLPLLVVAGVLGYVLYADYCGPWLMENWFETRPRLRLRTLDI